MKKIFWALILIILFISNTYASCGKIDWSIGWKDTGVEWRTERDRFVVTFYNGSDKSLKITKLHRKYSDGSIYRTYATNILLKPYTERRYEVPVKVNWDFQDNNPGMKWNYTCEPVPTSTYTYTPKPTKRCSETNYDAPCTCAKEPNAAKKKYCEIRKKRANKMSRSEAASYCAEQASEYTKEVGKEYYKDCMKDEGY